VLNRNLFFWWDFWVHCSLLQPRKDAWRRRREKLLNFLFLQTTSNGSFLTGAWAQEGSHRHADTAGRSALGAQPVPPRACCPAGLAYPTSHGSFGPGRRPACPPASQRFPHPAGPCSPTTACPGGPRQPPALPFGSQVLVAAVPLILAEPPLLSVFLGECCSHLHD